MNRTMPEPKKLTLIDWFLLAEAALLMGLARMAVLTLPFRWVMRACGTHMAESPLNLPAGDAEAAARVAWAIDTMRLFTPWDSNCLAQAIASARMLQRRGVATTTYLGVASGQKNDLDAHAWVRCGEKIILGEQNHTPYAAVSSFATSGSVRGKR